MPSFLEWKKDYCSRRETWDAFRRRQGMADRIPALTFRGRLSQRKQGFYIPRGKTDNQYLNYMFENRMLELHCNGRQILDLSKIHDAIVKETTPNECKVLTGYSVLPITDRKDCYFCIEIAKYQNKYFIGYDFGYNTGGGSSAPSLYRRSQFNDNLSLAIASLLNQLIVHFKYDRYIKDMKAALNVINRREPIQLTFNFFE